MSALSCPQQFVGVATGRDALQDALPRGTSKKGANLKTEKLMGKSLSSDSARAVRRSSKKERRDVQRRTRGSASLPAQAKWLGPIISTVHTVRSWAEREEAEWAAWSAPGSTMVENHNMVNPYRCVFVPCLNLNSEIEDSSSCSSSSFVLESLLAPKLPPGTGCDS